MLLKLKKNSFCCINSRKINIYVLGYLFNASAIKANMANLGEYELNNFEIECLVITPGKFKTYWGFCA